MKTKQSNHYPIVVFLTLGLLLTALSGLKALAETNTNILQTDTLWGPNNPTPDSMIYNIFSRPGIVHTYGTEGFDPDLNWPALDPESKKAYFITTINRFIQLFPNYDSVTSIGDTILHMQNATEDDYAHWAEYVIRGENNIKNDTGSSLNWSADIKQIITDHNGYYNLPVLTISDIRPNSYTTRVPHVASGIFIQDKIDENASVFTDLWIRNPKTNDSTLNVDPDNINSQYISVIWRGFSDGEYKMIELMTFLYHISGYNKLIYLNPKVFTINPEAIEFLKQPSADTTINYTPDWHDNISLSLSVNQDTAATFRISDPGMPNFATHFSYNFEHEESFETAPLMTGEAANYNFTITRNILAKFIQDGTILSHVSTFGDHYYTTLKQEAITQKITIKDLEAPSGNLRKTDTTVSLQMYAHQAALALIENISDNSNGTVTKTAVLKGDSDSLRTYLVGLIDITGNDTTLGEVHVHFSTTDINELQAEEEKNGILKIWPNPMKSDDKLLLTYLSKNPAQVTFEVYNLSAQKIFSYTTTVYQKEQQIQLPLPPLPAGTYFIICGDQKTKVVVK